MGLPEINISFINKAATLIQRSEKGIVAIILKDDTYTAKDQITYTSIDQVNEAWSAENKAFINFVFLGNPRKVIVQRVGTTTPTLNTALSSLGNRKWNYLAYPDAAPSDLTTISTWVKSKRNTDKKIYKFVGGGLSAPDDMGIINFDSDNVSVAGTKYSKNKFACRIAGIAAGLPIDRSMTYYQLGEVEGFDELTDDTARNAAIDSGKLILINDGEKVKIARGVNSMTTTTATLGATFKKIRIVETVDTIREDLYETIKDDYVGKKINIYDNKLLLIAAINYYYTLLAKDQILDPNFNNKADIDTVAQRDYLKGIGVNVDDLSDQQIREYNTGDKVFITSNIKPTDAMEDFSVNIYI